MHILNTYTQTLSTHYANFLPWLKWVLARCSMRAEKRAFVTCANCSVKFGTTAHHLTESIDVYNEWIDECEEANNRRAARHDSEDDEVC
ncbi:hypothetical protein Ciccas_011500 [Cichlidogyrus casuarinus]|uniref:Transcription elongation factor 1 homolog n=1 Tax=Cichlidogyrus casuarinus TaxID=1844966 RepID=A0ABD2PR35_9PLAT